MAAIGQGGAGKRWESCGKPMDEFSACRRADLRIGMYRVTAILSAVRKYPPQASCVFKVHSKVVRSVIPSMWNGDRGPPSILPLSLSHIPVKICLETPSSSRSIG